jgi:hypothetical protein
MKEASVQAAEPQVAGGGVDETPPTALGPLPCISCGQSVLWVRVDGFWILRDEDGHHHQCPA